MITLAKLILERKSNFTLIRHLAAILVLYFHCYPLMYGLGGNANVVNKFSMKLFGFSLGQFAVGVFFIISGFLISGSYLNKGNLQKYFIARILRIFPALVVCIAFLTLILGPVLSNIEIHEYFRSRQTWNYLIRNSLLFTDVTYVLPGVFLDNPFAKSVNGSLWTLPIELWMYIFIGFIGYFGILKNRPAFNAMFIAITALYITPSPEILSFKHKTITDIYFFIVGSWFYVNKEKIFLSPYFLMFFALSAYLSSGKEWSELVTVFTISYFVLFFSLYPKFQLTPIEKYGDISYGIYIYAFPVQQFLVSRNLVQTALELFFVSLPIVIVLSILSWQLIEKKALSLKAVVLKKPPT